jgi:hypothetical protein
VPLTASARPISHRLLLAVVAAGLMAGPAPAQAPAFDLAGPSLRVSVTHDGETLPLSQVPNLSVGDRLRVTAELPAQQGARYRMVLAFLRGATNPPPKDWLFDAETWKPKKATVDVVVPRGAEQAVVLLVPDTGGAVDAVTSAIRSRPGAFVRASKELNQTMLDRTRLETFVDKVRDRPPAQLAAISPQLAQSLAVKLDTDCLLRQPDARAACLTQGSNAAVLADGQTSSLAQTLAGTPADIALRVSSTPQAGYGYYSPYIGVVRDVARLFGAFQSAQLQFIPALGVPRGELTALLLNTVPSFRKPQSVLVAALPSVTAATLPPLVTTADTLCASRPRLVLPVVGAPLVFATGYARNMALRVHGTGGDAHDISTIADPTLGGYVVDGAQVAAAIPPGALREGVLHGRWGFRSFEGPSFRLVTSVNRPWHAAEGASLVVGRDTPLTIEGGAAACVAEILVKRGDVRLPVSWVAQAPDRLSLQVPLTGAEPGPVTISVRSHGVAEPQSLELRAYAQAGQIADFTLHAGDQKGVLTGTRLDQVASLTLDGATFRAAGLDRVGTGDRLSMTSDQDAVRSLEAGQARTARVALVDGRSVALKVVIARPRLAVTLVSRSVHQVGPALGLPLKLQAADVMAQDGQLLFSLRAESTSRFTTDDKVEIVATETGQRTSLPLRLQDEGVAVATLMPGATLGPSAYGPLRYRVVQDGVAGDWQPLVTLVRLPRLDGLACATETKRCVLRGTDLFLIRSVQSGSGADNVRAVPDGFTGSEIEVPHAEQERLLLTLRDAPGVQVEVPEPS